MKFLKSFFTIFMLCLLFGHGTENHTYNDAKKDEIIKDDTMEIILEPVTCDAGRAETENNFSISIDSKDGKIILFDTVSGKELVSLEEAYGNGNLFLSMADENIGAILYCSSPACGQMMKQIYLTKDRWQTYDQMDISLQIDGYPTSLSAQSAEYLLVGAQMRSDGYMFETIDGGKSWNPVIIDEGIAKCRYGYAPIANGRESIFYALLECDGFYSLYQSDDALSAWKQLGTFSPEMEIESYFIWKDKVIVTDIQGQHYQLSFAHPI